MRNIIIEIICRRGGVIKSDFNGVIQFEFSHFPDPDWLERELHPIGCRITYCGTLITVIY